MNSEKIKQMTRLGILCALSVALVSFVHFSIFPAVPFLEYDPADISILIGTFMYGPVAGLILTVVVSLVQGLTVSAGSGWYGIIMHIVSTGTFALVSGFIYQKMKNKNGAIVALGCGTLSMTFVMFFANLVITPLFMEKMGVTVETVLSLMPFILLFNLLKAGINSVLTFLLYKQTAALIRK